MQFIHASLIVSIVSSALILEGCAAIIPAGYASATAITAHFGAATVVVAAAGVGVATGLVAPDLYKALEADAANAGAAQEPGSFGAFLASSQTEVRTLVQRAMQTQREILVVAGIRAQNTIARGRAAFKDSLPLRASAIGEQEKTFKSELEALIAGLYSPSDMTVKTAGERAQFMASRLRPPADVPLLNASGPVLLFPFLPFQNITVSGNFPAVPGNTMVPQLSVGGKSYKAFDYGPDSLSFSVHTADLNAEEAGKISWKSGVISVARISTSRFSSAPETAQLGLEIGVLPNSFGRISVDHAIITLRTEEKTRQSEDFSLAVGQAETANRQCLVLAPQELAEGWRIRPGSSAFVPGAGAAGLQIMDVWKLGLVSENEQAVCWSARAERVAEDPANQGAIPAAKSDWKIAATIWRNVKDPGTSRENVDLTWGSRHYFKYPAGSWKLQYSRSDTGVTELASADTSHPLIRVTTDAAGLTVSIYPF